MTQLFAIGSIKEDYLGSVTHITQVFSANNLQVLYDAVLSPWKGASTCSDAQPSPSLAADVCYGQKKARTVKERPCSLSFLVADICQLLRVRQ